MKILKQAITTFSNTRASQAAASLAYYAIFSLFPLLLLLVASGDDGHPAVESCLYPFGQAGTRHKTIRRERRVQFRCQNGDRHVRNYKGEEFRLPAYSGCADALSDQTVFSTDIE